MKHLVGRDIHFLMSKSLKLKAETELQLEACMWDSQMQLPMHGQQN